MSRPVTPVSVRTATPSDAPALAALQRGIYSEGRWFVGDGPPTAETVRGRLRTLVSARSLFLVAVPKDAEDKAKNRDIQDLWGWLELHRLNPKKLEHVAVLTLAVAHAYRRQGVAGALLARAYPWAREVGVYKIQLSVRAENQAALALYEREGFGLEGRERDQVFDNGAFEDNVLMAKFL